MNSVRPVPLSAHGRSSSEAGFSLVEALTAVLILVIGIIAVVNLIVVATTNNTAANHGSAATAQATETLERLKAIPFALLTPGGDLADANPADACDAAAVDCLAAPLVNYDIIRDIPGVGRIRTLILVRTAATAATVAHITVRSESSAPLLARRSRSEFATYRTCTSAGCPF